MRSRDEGAKAWIADTLWQAGLHAMGSRTYFDMAGYWPTSTDLLAAPMNEIPKIVFTRQPSLDLAALASADRAGWAGTEIADGDMAIWRQRSHGSSNSLARKFSLMAAPVSRKAWRGWA
jgi:dihydrofolate reductase